VLVLAANDAGDKAFQLIGAVSESFTVGFRLAGVRD